MNNKHTLNIRGARWAAAAVTALTLATSAASAWAGIFTITFDTNDPIGGLASGTTLSTQYAAATGATFAPNAFSGASTQPGTNGTWATNSDMTVTSTDVNGAITAPASGNVLHAYNNGWLNENGDTSFRMSFSTPVSTLSAVFFSINNTYVLADKLYAYSGNTLLGTTSAVSGAGATQTLTISSGTPITSVVFTAGSYSDWVAVDNISFTTVPEPSAVALLGLAGLSLCFLRKFRGKAASLAAA